MKSKLKYKHISAGSNPYSIKDKMNQEIQDLLYRLYIDLNNQYGAGQCHVISMETLAHLQQNGGLCRLIQGNVTVNELNLDRNQVINQYLLHRPNPHTWIILEDVNNDWIVDLSIHNQINFHFNFNSPVIIDVPHGVTNNGATEEDAYTGRIFNLEYDWE